MGVTLDAVPGAQERLGYLVLLDPAYLTYTNCRYFCHDLTSDAVHTSLRLAALGRGKLNVHFRLVGNGGEYRRFQLRAVQAANRYLLGRVKCL